MSYIICEGNNYYKPSNHLRGLFEKLMVQPFNTFNNDPPTSAWEEHVKNKNYSYHMNAILSRGSADFNNGFPEPEHLPYNPFQTDSPTAPRLSPYDKVLLYCLYYMPMHLYGSYQIFRKFRPVSSEVIFIDCGCGPLTSGIAFWAAFAGRCDITYIGVDKASPMLEKAKQINQHGSFFTNPNLLERWDQIDASLSQLITNGDGTPIIFNFCYLLAPDTWDDEHSSVQDLADTLNRIRRTYNRHNMFVIYQNPHSFSMHENWRSLGVLLPGFQRCTTQSDAESFSYRRLTDGSIHKVEKTLYFEILSHKPFEPPRITPYSARSSHGESIDETTIIEF